MNGLDTAEWLTIWGVICGVSLAHVAFWAWLFRDAISATFWWL